MICVMTRRRVRADRHKGALTDIPAVIFRRTRLLPLQ